MLFVRTLVIVCLALTMTTAASAQPAADPPPADASARLLAEADAAIAAQNLERAIAAFERLRREHAGSPEALHATCALAIVGLATGKTAPPLLPARASARAGDDTVLLLDPYSRRTSERLHLSTWEKLDFGITSFIYGLSLGLSLSVAVDESTNPVGPMTLGALAYTLGSVAYLNIAKPDRGDLPLALAITSYLPTATLLLLSAASENPDERSTSIITSVVALGAIPLAVWAGRRFDLDPGDTQLVRDAGFWGMVLAGTGAMGLGATEMTGPYGGVYETAPSGRFVLGVTAAGLAGGLLLGGAAAAVSEVSLERVRVTTWGGYGGLVLGALLGASGSNEESTLFTSMSVGAALGLVTTFLATAGIDGIPADRALMSGLPADLAPAVLAAPPLVPGSGISTLFGVAGAWR